MYNLILHFRIKHLNWLKIHVFIQFAARDSRTNTPIHPSLCPLSIPVFPAWQAKNSDECCWSNMARCENALIVLKHPIYHKNKPGQSICPRILVSISVNNCVMFTCRDVCLYEGVFAGVNIHHTCACGDCPVSNKQAGRTRSSLLWATSRFYC